VGVVCKIILQNTPRNERIRNIDFILEQFAAAEPAE
jgi:hypothetical protein